MGLRSRTFAYGGLRQTALGLVSWFLLHPGTRGRPQPPFPVEGALMAGGVWWGPTGSMGDICEAQPPHSGWHSVTRAAGMGGRRDGGSLEITQSCLCIVM